MASTLELDLVEARRHIRLLQRKLALLKIDRSQELRALIQKELAVWEKLES